MINNLKKLASIMTRTMKYSMLFVLLFALVSASIYWFKTPLQNTQWEEGQEKNASISILSTDKEPVNQQQVVIRNMRDFDWVAMNKNINKNVTKNDSQKANKHLSLEGTGYRDLQFNLNELKSLKVAVSHFSVISELAHVFLLFELKGGESFGLSVEARREKGEEYTLTGGLLAQFELVYLIASESDLVGLRKQRNEKIYIYPIKIDEDGVQKLFKVVAGKTNRINEKAEFYHLFLKNCTTQIVDLVNNISDKKFPKLVQSFAPGKAGNTLYEMGLVNIKADSFEALQKIALLK